MLLFYPSQLTFSFFVMCFTADGEMMTITRVEGACMICPSLNVPVVLEGSQKKKSKVASVAAAAGGGHERVSTQGA